MSSRITLRAARPEERLALEERQRRASLEWEEYREALPRGALGSYWRRE